MNINKNVISFVSLFQREVHRFFKMVTQTIFSPIIAHLLYLVIFGASLGKNIPISFGGQDVSYLLFLVPGLVAMSVFYGALENSSASVISGRFSGDLQDLKTSPFHHEELVAAISLGAVVRGFVVGAHVFLASQVFYFFNVGKWVPIYSVGLLLLFCFLGALCFGMLGMTVAMLARSFDQFSSVVSFFLTPLIYLGGVFFSIQNLAPAWQTLVVYNPLFYFINGIRYATLGISDVSLSSILAASTVSVFVLFGISSYIIRKSSFTNW